MTSINVDDRYVLQNRALAIPDIETGLTEVLNNANDADASATQQGIPHDNTVDISISGGDHTITIIDRSLGMTEERAVECLTNIGKRTSDDSSTVHGTFCRGAKYTGELGKITYHCLKDGRLTTLILRRDLSFTVHSELASHENAIIFHGHNQGVCVTIDIIDTYWQYDILKLISKIENYVPTRFLFSHPDKHFFISATGASGEALMDRRRLWYVFPAGELHHYDFQVNGYTDVWASLDLIVTDEAILESKDEKQQKFGILVCGDDTIYDLTFLRDSFRFDENFRRIHGRLHCTHIRELMRQWDEQLLLGITDPFNSKPIIKPNRSEGISVDHPFISKLYVFPVTIIQKHLLDLSRSSVSRSFTDFGSNVRNFEMFSSSFLSEANELQEFRRQANGSAKTMFSDLTGPIVWTERSAPELNILTTKSPTGTEQVNSDDLFKLFQSVPPRSHDAIERNFKINEEGELVVISADDLTEDIVYINASSEQFSLDLQFDDRINPVTPVRQIHDRNKVFVFIHVNHPLVRNDLKLVDGEIIGMEQPSSQTCVAFLIGRVMGELVGESTPLDERSPHFLQNVSDRFTAEIRFNFMKNSETFKEYTISHTLNM